jgi:hypothetical protein
MPSGFLLSLLYIQMQENLSLLLSSIAAVDASPMSEHIHLPTFFPYSPSSFSLDFSPSAFSQLADQGIGRLNNVEWQFI